MCVEVRGTPGWRWRWQRLERLFLGRMRFDMGLFPPSPRRCARARARIETANGPFEVLQYVKMYLFYHEKVN